MLSTKHEIKPFNMQYYDFNGIYNNIDDDDDDDNNNDNDIGNDNDNDSDSDNNDNDK